MAAITTYQTVYNNFVAFIAPFLCLLKPPFLLLEVHFLADDRSFPGTLSEVQNFLFVSHFNEKKFRDFCEYRFGINFLEV